MDSLIISWGFVTTHAHAAIAEIFFLTYVSVQRALDLNFMMEKG